MKKQVVPFLFKCVDPTLSSSFYFSKMTIKRPHLSLHIKFPYTTPYATTQWSLKHTTSNTLFLFLHLHLFPAPVLKHLLVSHLITQSHSEDKSSETMSLLLGKLSPKFQSSYPSTLRHFVPKRTVLGTFSLCSSVATIMKMLPSKFSWSRSFKSSAYYCYFYH